MTITPPTIGLPPACRRVLITGGGGFVGRHLRRFLLENGPPDLVVQSAGREGEQVDVAFDLRQPDSVAEAINASRPDLVFHLAGEASVAGAGRHAADTWRVNVGGTLALATALGEACPGATMVFASSAEVYGDAFLDGEVDEKTRPAPRAVYAQSKLAAEAVLASVLPASAALILARPSNHIGPGQDQRFALPSFAAQLAAAERAGETAVIRVGNLAAERDFLDVRDVVRAYGMLAARAHGTGRRETFTIASGRSIAIGDMLDQLRAAAKVDSIVEPDPERMRPAEIPVARISANRLRTETGWSPLYAITDTVKDVLDDWRGRLAP